MKKALETVVIHRDFLYNDNGISHLRNQPLKKESGFLSCSVEDGRMEKGEHNG